MGMLLMIVSVILIIILVFVIIGLIQIVFEDDVLFKHVIITISIVVCLGSLFIWLFKFGYKMNTKKSTTEFLSQYEINIDNVHTITKTTNAPLQKLNTKQFKNYSVIDTNQISNDFYFVINTENGYKAYRINSDKYSKFDSDFEDYLDRIQNITLDSKNNILFTKLYVENFIKLPKDKEELESKKYQKYLHEKAEYIDSTSDDKREFLPIPNTVEDNKDFANDLTKDSKLLLDSKYKKLEAYHIQKVRFE